MHCNNRERREVAQSLLSGMVGLAFSYRDVRNSLNDGWVQRTLWEIRLAIGCENDPCPARWLARLAELIDPTCEREDDDTYEDLQYRGTSLCSECGELLISQFRYCPRCGARIVDNE